MQPKLSVIVPAYKVEPYLRQCMDSIVNQTFKDLEVICIDDGSPDNCGKIFDEYAEKQEEYGVKIRVIHKQNGGLMKAWNQGMELAAGEYLTFVDSDDWLDTDYYERMFAALGDRDADVFCAGGKYIETGDNTELDLTLDEPFFFENGENRAYLMGRALVRVPSKKSNKRLNSMNYIWDKFYKTRFIQEKLVGWNKHDNYGATLDGVFEINVFSKAERAGGCLEVGYHYRKFVEGAATSRYWPNALEIAFNNADDIYAVINGSSVRGDAFLNDAYVTRCQLMFVWNSSYIIHPENKVSYRTKSKQYKELKSNPHYHEALRRRTSLDTGKFYLRMQIYRYTGLWGLYLIAFVRKLLNKRD